ncbi:MAG: DegT/DnrJ/EryC1/StrS family aminotransferase, partial [Clostridia bacterium]|nr:DegT/DnrJ/EryC1/StrS family aminotransferase [Clostridia bacterium]
MQKDLYTALKKYATSNPIRFHMPAHNGVNLGIDTSLDITELSFSDNLIESDGVIKNCEDNIAKAYGTKYSLMLTNGATMGVAIALYTAKNNGNKLLLLGDLHKSVHNYANVFGFDVSYAETLNDINPDNFNAIILTTPDYFGKVTDIQKLKNTTALVIADSSHGAHFAFSSKLPNLLTNIADITILSFHKTLPVLTGGAGIVTNDKELYDMLVYSRSLLHSSSPSYLTMASIDNAICEFFENGENLYNQVYLEIENFKNQLCDRYSVIENDDFTRLCISTKGKDGNKIAKLLESKNIYLEMVYFDCLVAIVTPYNFMHLTALANALNLIDINDQIERFYINKPTKIDIKGKNVKLEDIKKILNKVCANTVGIYPPGTPL